jgi:hypothetical protein
MKTTENTPTDLIAQKTGEYDRFPGLLLGLDGWILRSVPKSLRRQFLEGYEKLLRIVFHPDRYQDPAIKQSRQSYLQSVSEAVSFMAQDEFSFEIASDAVPTKRNPFVALQHEVDRRDDIISRFHSEVDAARDGAAEAVKSEQELRKTLDQTLERNDRERRLIITLRNVLYRMIRSFPVPVDCLHHVITGSFVKVESIPQDNVLTAEGSTDVRSLYYKLDHYSSEADTYCGDSNWFLNGMPALAPDRRKDKYRIRPGLKAGKNGKLEIPDPVEEDPSDFRETFAPYLEKETSLRFRKRNSRDGKFTIIGAMSVAHLCEYLRAQRLTLPKKGWLAEAFERLLRLVTDEATGQVKIDARSKWTGEVGNYLIPFYQPGVFLLLRPHRDHQEINDPQMPMRLFLVKGSDYEESPNQALISGYKEEVRQAMRDSTDAQTKLKGKLGKKEVENSILKTSLHQLQKTHQVKADELSQIVQWYQELKRVYEEETGKQWIPPTRPKSKRKRNLNVKPNKAEK